jgi:hypothetical protein
MAQSCNAFKQLAAKARNGAFTVDQTPNLVSHA